MTIATPHHWHALATVLCLQAGKHVYIEKPVTHTFDEGPAVLAAAAKYPGIVQAGNQLRSNESLAAAGEYMRSGKLGHVELVHGIVYKDRPQTPIAEKNVKIPTTVDFDLWCGPGPSNDVTRSKFHYHWHWLWQYGNGALGNNGVHRIDTARIALDLKGYGDLVISAGGRYGEPDSGETPNNQLTLHRFGSTWFMHDVLGVKPQKYHGMDNAVVFYGTEGTIVYKKGYAALYNANWEEVFRFEGKQRNHYFNFLTAVRQKDQTLANGALSEGVVSSNLCHLGNISYRVGQPSTFADVRAEFERLSVPHLVLDRLEAMRQNLAANNLPEEIRLGPALDCTGDQSSPIVGNDAASALLKSEHRNGFKLPDPAAV